MKKFLPLIIVTLLTLIFAYGHTLWLDGGIMLFMQYFMAGYFLFFGGLKILNWKNFVLAYSAYDDVAKRSKIYARVYPALEFGLGILYYFAFALFYVNLFVAILMLQKGYSVLKKLESKETVTCACLGGFFGIPVTHITLFEDLLMAGMALSMLF